MAAVAVGVLAGMDAELVAGEFAGLPVTGFDPQNISPFWIFRLAVRCPQRASGSAAPVWPAGTGRDQDSTSVPSTASARDASGVIQRVRGDHRAGQVNSGEQCFEFGDLVRLRVDGPLGEDDVVLLVERGEQLAGGYVAVA